MISDVWQPRRAPTIRVERERVTDPVTLMLAKERRDRNRANGDCVNENKRGTHGKATHGVRCARCAEAYRRSC